MSDSFPKGHPLYVACPICDATRGVPCNPTMYRGHRARTALSKLRAGFVLSRRHAALLRALGWLIPASEVRP